MGKGIVDDESGELAEKDDVTNTESEESEVERLG